MPTKAKHARMIKGESGRPARRTAAQRGYGADHRRMVAILKAMFPICQIAADCCTGFSEEGHHLRYPARSVEDYLAVCRACHRWLERNK